MFPAAMLLLRLASAQIVLLPLDGAVLDRLLFTSFLSLMPLMSGASSPFRADLFLIVETGVSLFLSGSEPPARVSFMSPLEALRRGRFPFPFGDGMSIF